MTLRSTLSISLVSFSALVGCGSDDNASVIGDQEREQQATAAVRTYITEQLDALHAAAVGIRDAAPAPDMDGWDGTKDAAAVATMKTHWKEARRAYERVEGAIAVLFPDLDASTDERYDGFIEEAPDANLFDGEGVTGVHAIERILWSDSIPASVVAFEEPLDGYIAAAFPKSEAEARDFKDKLCTRLVDDTTEMQSVFKSRTLDAASAYRGVIGSMNEQVEKVGFAATGQEESRYAQHTLADMKSNIEGGQATFEAFRSWIVAKGGDALAKPIDDGFQRINDKLDSYQGDAIPPVPEDFSSENPSGSALATPFGQLFQLVLDESDPAKQGSLVQTMTTAANDLGIKDLP